MRNRNGTTPIIRAAKRPDPARMERWPCGCVKGYTAHGVGWSDCEYTPEQQEHQKQRWLNDDYQAYLGSPGA